MQYYWRVIPVFSPKPIFQSLVPYVSTWLSMCMTKINQRRGCMCAHYGTRVLLLRCGGGNGIGTGSVLPRANHIKESLHPNHETPHGSAFSVYEFVLFHRSYFGSSNSHHDFNSPAFAALVGPCGVCLDRLVSTLMSCLIPQFLYSRQHEFGALDLLHIIERVQHADNIPGGVAVLQPQADRRVVG